MEAKFWASVFSFLSIFLAIYAQSDLRDFAFETAIYYGDSNVNIGEPFSITCIIPLTDPIAWLKDGEPITLHNLRHGRDEHSYMLSESNIEGEKHKIEAHIKVRHALKVHEGSYQCNDRHSSYHTLHVHSPIVVPKPQTKSPFIITADDGHLSTESVYETIHDLTPSTADEIFTRVWEMDPESPAMPLPTQITTTPIHRRPHHHHHQQQQQQLPKEPKADERNKLIYINATNFDGSPSRSASEGDSKEGIGLINLEYLPPTRHSEFTTVPWPQSVTNRVKIDRTAVSARSEYPPMPDFPPPRTAMYTTTAAPPAQYYTPTHHHGDHHSHGITTTRGYHQEPQAKFPLQTAQPTYYQHARPASKPTTFQTAMPYPTQTQPLNTYQQYNQMQTYPPQQTPNQRLQQQQQHVPSATASSSSTTTTMLLPAPAPTAHMPPIRKEPDFLVPNYDNPQHKLKVFEIRSPLVLSCNITKEGDYELKWEKNGTIVSKVRELSGRYRIIAPERKFIIDRTDTYDDGLYSCVANNHKKDINVVARVVVRVPSNSGVVEGEKLTIVCTVVGTDPQLSWAIGNLTISNSTGRYILKPDDNQVQNAILSVENVSLDDRGEFKCIGRNAANEYANYAEASDVSYVRVKGKLAALWPFLGICAEVLILCAIILIYEKRRNKSELEESDTDPQEQKKKRRNYD